jgi:ABC-type uncharacterized transport system ATPase subunit
MTVLERWAIGHFLQLSVNRFRDFRPCVPERRAEQARNRINQLVPLIGLVNNAFALGHHTRVGVLEMLIRRERHPMSFQVVWHDTHYRISS